MDRPALPPPAPGRSALGVFLPVERHLKDQVAAEEARIHRLLEEAEAEALRLREEGEQRLKQVVLDAERQALREVESRSRDRVSEARVAVQRWIDAAERTASEVVEAALDLCCRPPAPPEGGA